MQFCSGGGVEHCKLRLDQMKREETSYVYYDNGTFSERNVGKKVVKSITVPEASERCHVYWLDPYISKLPSDAHKAGAIYFRPLP